MSVRVTQLSYNSGIMSGLMSGRADDTKYGSGLQVCRNARCTPQGPIENRPGFMYVAETKYPDKKARLIPFTYSTNETMIIELGNQYARFHTQGKTLMNAEGTAPYEIATPWKEEDLFDVHYTQNSNVMTLVHQYYPPQELRRQSLTDWRLSAVSLVPTLTPPQEVNAERITQAANDANAKNYTQKYVVTALNEDRTQESEKSDVAEVKEANLYATGTTVKISWEPVDGASWYRVYKLQGGIYGFIGQTQELEIVDDNIAPETGETPPYYDDVFKTNKGIESVEVVDGGSGYERSFKDMYISGNVFQGPEEDRTLKGLTFTSIHQRDDTNIYWSGSYTGGAIKGLYASHRGNFTVNNFYFNSGGWSGGRIATGKYSTLTGKIRMSINQSHPSMDEAESDRVELVVEDSTGRGAVVRPVIRDGVIVAVTVLASGANYTDPKIRVVSEVGSGAKFTVKLRDGKDFPAAVGYFEQRRVFAGTPLKPQSVWMTVTGADSNMTYHLPIQDDDRVSVTVAARDLNLVQHVVALQQLILLTSAAEWRVSPLNSDAITPTSISIRPQSYVGASSTQPVVANNTALYVSARGGHIREIAYNYNAGGYITGDLSLRATGLFDEQDITDLSFSKEPFPVVWAVSTSGSLLGLTYVPEQQVGAWFEYTTDGVFESAAVVQEGFDDSLYVVVNRVVNGAPKRFVERATKRDDTSANSGNYLDCSGVYSGDATETVTGLTWLAGQEVTVNADGAVVTGLTVGEDGTLTLPKKASRVVVGLPYSMEVQTMPIVAQVSDGSLAKGHTKNVSRVWLRLKNSAAPEVGSDFSDMAQVKTRTKETFGEPPRLIDGVIEALPPGKWEDDTGVCVRMDKPLPFTLISHSSEIELGG